MVAGPRYGQNHRDPTAALNPITESPMPGHDLKYTLSRGLLLIRGRTVVHTGNLCPLINGNIALSIVGVTREEDEARARARISPTDRAGCDR